MEYSSEVPTMLCKNAVQKWIPVGRRKFTPLERMLDAGRISRRGLVELGSR